MGNDAVFYFATSILALTLAVGCSDQRQSEADGWGFGEDGAVDDTSSRDDSGGVAPDTKAGPTDSGTSDTGGVCAEPSGPGGGGCASDADCPENAVCLDRGEICMFTEFCLEEVQVEDSETPEDCGLKIDHDGTCYEKRACDDPTAVFSEIGDACSDDGTCPDGMDCYECSCVELETNAF